MMRSSFSISGLIWLGALEALAPKRCPAASPCASTPAAAVRVFEGGTAELSSEGYRVVRMRRDTVLGTRWATVERCGHPEWPGMTVRASSAAVSNDFEAEKTSGGRAGPSGMVTAAPLPKVIRAGETVRLWRQDTNVRLEMAAVSEEGGAAGERIRMRVIAHQEYGESVRYVYGLVRGPADVEME